MGAEDLLVIVAWAGIALCLIGIGIAKSRKQATRHSQIFHPGNEEWAKTYVGAIYAIEEEWAERQRT